MNRLDKIYEDIPNRYGSKRKDTISVLIKDDKVPEITFNGKKFWLVQFNYTYFTSTDVHGTQQLIATGYIDGTSNLMTIFHDFGTDTTSIQGK